MNSVISQASFKQTQYAKTVLIMGIIAFLIVGFSCAGLVSGIKQSYKMSNTSFDIVDTSEMGKLNKVAVVNGTSLVLDKKAKRLNTTVLEFTDRFQGYLVEKLNEKGIIAMPGKTETTLAVNLIDPFRITSREEAKVLSGKKPDYAELNFVLREWEECENCKALADSLKAEGLWVIWACWFKALEDMSKIEYEDKEKGWLHVSAQLFSAKDGKLVAWTSINRTGKGIWPFTNWSAAYSAIAEGMADNLAKHMQEGK